VHATSISGLKGLTFIDKVAGNRSEEGRDKVEIDGQTDRVFLNAREHVAIHDASLGSISLKREHLDDVVVWNIWSEKIKAMADMGSEDWREYVCAEAAVVDEPVQVKAGHSWFGRQEIRKM